MSINSTNYRYLSFHPTYFCTEKNSPLKSNQIKKSKEICHHEQSPILLYKQYKQCMGCYRHYGIKYTGIPSAILIRHIQFMGFPILYLL